MNITDEAVDTAAAIISTMPGLKHTEMEHCQDAARAALEAAAPLIARRALADLAEFADLLTVNANDVVAELDRRIREEDY